MKRLAYLLLTLIGFAQAVAGIHDIRFSQIGIDKGLSHSTINGISQDRLGYIWVATPDGLNRYDGYRFTTFSPDSADHNVRAVVTDAAGDVWAVTAHMLACYTPATERFCVYPFPSGATLNALLPLGDGKIALGASDGMYIFNSADGSFSERAEVARHNVTAMTLFGGNIMAGTSAGDVLELRGGKAVPVAMPAKAEINTFLTDRGSLLIGTEGAGLYSYSPATGRVEALAQNIGADYVRSLITDSQRRLWIGTFTGLHVLDPDRRRCVFHEDATAADGALSHSSVRRMFADSQGGIWLGTYFGGLNYYHPQQNQFTTLRKHGDDIRSLSGSVAGPIAQDSRGNIWIGTNNGGLNIYSPATGEFAGLSRRDGLGSDDVKAIYIDEPAGRAYVGTHIGGLSVLDLATRRITPYRGIAQSVYDIIPALLPGHLWLATLDGVSLLDTSSMTAVSVDADDMPGLTTNLLRDAKGRLWVGGEDGLAVYSESPDGRLSPVAGMPRLDAHVNDVYQSRINGKYWVSTHRGLLCFDEAPGEPSRYDIADGMPGDIVYATLEDPNGNIWATTNRGLACLNPQTGAIMTYSNRDGLANSQFTDRSAMSADNGLMYFGGIDGVTFFNPTVLEKNTMAPRPIIEGVRLFNRPVRPGDDTGLLAAGMADTRRLTFDADQTNFTLDFTACDYVSKGDNSFQYMLDGLDKQWTMAPTGVRSVTYSNLPAGRYTFRLRAANNDGVWSPDEASVEVVILPPWYRTWWALLLFIAAGAAGAYLAVRYVWRRKSLEKQQKAREEVNEMKVRFFVNMSHELRTPLTLMLLPLNELIDSRPDPATLHKLTTVRNNTLRIRHIVNQLLDYRRAELGMFKLGVSALDINSLFNSILESYQALADKKRIRLLFDSTVGDTPVYADINYIELIANNLLTNAFKYTPDGGEIKVCLSLAGSRLRIVVADSGCGIPADKLDTIFTRFYQLDDSVGGYGIGLSLVKRLVELHHGSIGVESAVGKGSTFTVDLPASASAYAAEEMAAEAHASTDRAEDVQALLPVSDEVPETAPDAAGRKTVLVVDDNAEILKYLSAAMSKDFRVLTAANGTKAIEVLGGDTVDLVISDVMMPDMDGVQLCRAIKRNLRTSHIPVILLSAKADVADRLDGLKVGADDYIAKPFQMELLIAKVRNQVRTRENIIQHYSQTSTEIEPAKVAQNPLDEEFLTKAVKIMNEHLDDSQFTTDEFARQICMSRSNLHLKMKALTGESTNDFIRRTRMRKAAELLKTRRYTVAEVSAMVGYSTPSYFATAFKGFYGYSPSTLISTNP